MTIKPRTRKAMIAYLAGHFRYHTMNSRNQAHSYAIDIKVSHVDGLTHDEREACYELLDLPNCHEVSGFHQILRGFDQRYRQSWQIGSNGRSGGYLVLYQGGQEDSKYKSECLNCGQLNYQAVPEGTVGQCGRCGEMERHNLDGPLMRTFTKPGLGLDMDRDYEDWETSAIRDRVALVWDFDKTCERAVQAFVRFAVSHRIEEREIMVNKTIKIAVKKSA